MNTSRTTMTTTKIICSLIIGFILGMVAVTGGLLSPALKRVEYLQGNITKLIEVLVEDEALLVQCEQVLVERDLSSPVEPTPIPLDLFHWEDKDSPIDL